LWFFTAYRSTTASATKHRYSINTCSRFVAIIICVDSSWNCWLSLRKNFIEKKKSKGKNKIDRFNWKIRVRVDAQRGERILNWRWRMMTNW
jgi:hypothetical protein